MLGSQRCLADGTYELHAHAGSVVKYLMMSASNVFDLPLTDLNPAPKIRLHRFQDGSSAVAVPWFGTLPENTVPVSLPELKIPEKAGTHEMIRICSGAPAAAGAAAAGAVSAGSRARLDIARAGSRPAPTHARAARRKWSS